MGLDLHGDGGGFGIGSDVTYGANAKLDWRFAKHFGLSFGYALLHFEVSDTVAQRTFSLANLQPGAYHSRAASRIRHLFLRHGRPQSTSIRSIIASRRFEHHRCLHASWPLPLLSQDVLSI